jgi:hypothetical protein
MPDKKKDEGAFLGFRISKKYEDKLIKRQAKQRDERKSHTARKILYAALDKE